MATCNKLSIDVAGLFNAIQNECYLLLNVIADKIINDFRPIIIAEGRGIKHIWRKNAANEFRVLSDKIATEVVELEFGIREDLEWESWGSFYAAQVMVALFGNHPPAEGFYTKPGEITFHDHMESLDESHAQGVYRLPEGFNQKDPNLNKYLENLMKRTNRDFKAGVKHLLDNINFYEYVHVSGGG